MSSPFSRRKSSLWAMEGYKPKVRRMFGGGEIKETVISEWKNVRKCQILTNFHQIKRKKMERTKKRSQRDGASLPELLVTTHCLHSSMDNKKTHLDKTKKIKILFIWFSHTFWFCPKLKFSFIWFSHTFYFLET